MTSEEHTPIDRPLTRADLNDVRKAIHDVSEKTLTMYEEFKGVRSQFRTYVAICVGCAFLCVVSVVITAVSAVTAATATKHARR